MPVEHPEWFHDLYFPMEEYHARLTRAQELMARNGIDALFLTDDRNTFYYGGFGDMNPMGSRARPRFLFLTQHEHAVYLVHESTEVTVGEMTWINDVRTYQPLTFPLLEVMAVFRDLRLDHTKVGAELGFEQRLGISFNEFLALQHALPNVEFVDAAPLLWEQRMVKSALELEMIRRACALTTQGFQKLFPRVRAGMTEIQVRGMMLSAMGEAGARGGWAKACTGYGQFDRIDGVNRERVIEPGDMVWLDAGANVGGYWADFSRCSVLGGPKALQREYQEKIWRVAEKGVEACRVGVACSDVWRVCEEAMAAEGLTFNTRPGRYGHGLGLFVTEPPHISADDHTVIQDGMVLTIEPGYIHERGIFHIEQNIVVTDTGPEVLSTCPWELFTAGE